MSAPDLDTMPESSRKVAVLAYLWPHVEERFLEVQKKINKLGNGSISWTVGDLFDKMCDIGTSTHPVQVVRKHRLVSVSVVCPCIAGWTVRGVLKRPDMAGAAMFYGDIEIPSEWRERAASSFCDHCKASRNRSTIVVLQHEDGRLLRVGKSCLKDFLGHSPMGALYAATVIGELRELLGLNVPPPSFVCWDLLEMLAKAAACARVLGWVPGRLHGMDNQVGTAYRIRHLPQTVPTVEPQDEVAACAACTWAASLPEDSIGYLANVRVVAQDGIVTPRTIGTAASIVAAHVRYLDKLARESEPKVAPEETFHVGELGDRITLPVEVLAIRTFDTEFGMSYLYKLRGTGPATVGKGKKLRTLPEADTATLSWFASRELPDVVSGTRLTLTGTVKKHTVYNDCKETQLNRCLVVAQ